MSYMVEQSAIKRRKRDPAFSPLEKVKLIELIEKHYSVIECKRTDAVSNRRKVSEWQQVGLEFNASSTYMEREVPALRNLWDNLKKKAKVSMAMMNEDRHGTGGGPQKYSSDDPITDRVISLLKTSVGGFQNTFDSDTPGASTESVVGTENHEDYDQQDQVLVNGADWSTNPPDLLKTPRPSIKVEDFFEEVALDIIDEGAPNSSTTSSDSNDQDVTNNEKKILRASTKPITASGLPNNKRRATFKKSEAAALEKTQINTLKMTNEYAKLEHESTVRLLKLQEEQEIERLKQEKEKTVQEEIKTEILRTQLKQLQEKASQ